MKTAKELVEALRNINDNSDCCFPAIVSSVDKVNSVCNVVFNDMELGGIRIQSTVAQNQNGIQIFPAINSVVIIEKLGDKGEYFISMFGEVEQVVYKIDTTTFTIKDGFLIKKDTDTLKAVFDDLIDQIKAIVVPTNSGPSGQPLNAIAFDLIKNRVDKLLK